MLLAAANLPVMAAVGVLEAAAVDAVVVVEHLLVVHNIFFINS